MEESMRIKKHKLESIMSFRRFYHAMPLLLKVIIKGTILKLPLLKSLS